MLGVLQFPIFLIYLLAKWITEICNVVSRKFGSLLFRKSDEVRKDVYKLGELKDDEYITSYTGNKAIENGLVFRNEV